MNEKATGILNEKIVDVPFRSVVCELHGEPLRAQWPLGYVIMAVELVDRCLKSPELAEEAKRATKKETPSPEEAVALLAKKAACCRVSREVLLELYEKAKIGEFKRCVHCKKKGLGTPFRVRGPAGDVDLPHVCFRCIVYRTQKTD